ncbi:MAG: hypothetical protein ABH890_02070 [Bacillota bacterium]
MKKMIRIVLLLLISIVLVSCNDEIVLELDTPQNVVIQNGVVTWDAVTDAESYLVVVGTDSYTVTVTTFDLNTLGLAPGEHPVHVVAMAGTDVSLPSMTVNFVIESASLDAIYEAALASIDETYEPGMVESDFEDEWEYRDYMQATQLVNAYSGVAVALGMTEAEAIAFFTHLATLPDRVDSITNFTTLFAEIDSFDQFNIESSDLANMFYEVGMVGMTIQMSNLADDIIYSQQELAQIQADILILQGTVNLTAIYTALAAYATPEELILLDYFFTGQYENTYWVLGNLWSIANDLVYNFEYYYPYYLDSGDEYTQMFYDILLRAKVANDTTLLDSFLFNNPLSDIGMLNDKYMMLNYVAEDIDRYTDEIARLGELYVFFTLEKGMAIDSIVDVIDYLFLIYDTIPNSLVLHLDDLVENGELTMEEYFLVKDEIVSVLLTTLPSDEDFANMYTTLISVAGAFQDVDLDAYLAYVDFFGDLDHAVLDLALTFASDVDQTTVEDIMAIVEDMVIPGEYVYDEYWEYWYYEDDTVDFEKAVELAVYVGNYLQDFKDSYAAKFTALDTLFADDQVEQLVNMFGNAVKQAMALEMDPDEYEMAEMIIDEILADYDNILAAADIVKTIGMNVVDEFLSSSGQMFLDIYALVNTSSGDMTDPLFVADLEAIFAQALNYNAAVMDELDISSIQTLLGLLRIPLKVQLMMEDMMDPAEFDLLFSTLITPVSTVISNVITLQKEFVMALDALDVETLLFDSSWNISGDVALMSILILALDDTLDFVNETLFFATITLVSESILKNADVMDLMGTTTLEVDDMIDMIETGFHEKFDEIHAIALFDFTATTITETDRIYAIFQTNPFEEEPVIN